MNNILTAIEEFIKHCKFEKTLSIKTIKAYSIDLSQLTKFLLDKKHSLDISSITKTELRKYLESISSLKPKSIKRKIATIKAMFNYLEFDDQIQTNPFRKLKIRIKEPKQLPRVMNIREANRVFKSVYKMNLAIEDKNTFSYKETLRNIVVVELLFSTGARVSEITNLKDDNIDTVTGVITIRGKGNKERIMQVCNIEALKMLREYRTTFIDKIIASGGFFLINRLGNKLSEQSIRAIVKTLAKKSEIQKHITPHVFRHTFATLLLEKDVDIKYIQALLGHSSIMTTQIYTHVNRKKQAHILRTKHPRKDFSMLPSLVS